MKISLKDITQTTFLPGFHGKMVHTDSMTIAYWDIEEGASLQTHHHIHEQVVNVLEGTFAFTVDGKEHILEAGDLFTIPSNVPHSGKAISACRIVDVFTPVREDYRD